MGWGNVRIEFALVVRIGTIAALSLALAHCGKVSSKYGVPASARVVSPGEPVPKGGGTYRVGRPYTIAGTTYTPEEDTNYSAVGLASWYGDDFHGRQTANGEVFDMHGISAAHPTLPLPSYVRVTNLRNHRSLVVRVNDRGPYHQGRVIDVSVRAAKLLGFYDDGTARVRVDYVGRAALEGSDDAKLAATLRRDGTPAPTAPPTMVASRTPAANTSFLGEFFNPKPLTRNPTTEVASRSPQPAAKPVHTTTEITARSRTAPAATSAPQVYSVASSHATTATVPGRAQVAANEQPASFNSRFGPTVAAPNAAVRAEPLSAYAPAQPSAASVLTGRGLY